MTFGSKLDLSGGDFQISDLSTPGQIYLTETSYDSAAALEAAQTSSFTLATFTLEGLSAGTTSVTFDSTLAPSLSDENANTLDLISATGGSLTVVPEPSSYAMAVLAMGLCGVRRLLRQPARCNA